VSAHALGWQLSHGVAQPFAGEMPVIRHACDNASCQRPACLLAGTAAENAADYQARRWRTGSPLADIRGARGRAVAVRDGGDVTLISTGAQTPRVVDAADLLAARGIQAHVLHVPTLKPLDVPAIVAAADRTRIVVTVEEGTVIGGLGGAVAETLSEYSPTVLKRLGMQDVYGESATNSELLELYGLSAARVADQVQAFLETRGTAGHASHAG